MTVLHPNISSGNGSLYFPGTCDSAPLTVYKDFAVSDLAVARQVALTEPNCLRGALSLCLTNIYSKGYYAIRFASHAFRLPEFMNLLFGKGGPFFKKGVESPFWRRTDRCYL
jgi:hypothetical protein